MASTSELAVLVDGLAFPEGPRWHEGRLWFSDQIGLQVMAVDLDGAVETVCEVPEQPSGLGWTPAGELLVVSMRDRRLLRLTAGGLVEAADLSPLALGWCNDMVVDAGGRAYVGNFGYDLYDPGARRRPANLLLAGPQGEVRQVAGGLDFPNGMAITPDGGTLLVAETFGGRVAAFDIEADGSLSGHRTWAELAGTPDGVSLDAEGCLWVASPGTRSLIRLAEGGEVRQAISTGGRSPYACMLGGPERRTLFACTASTHGPSTARLRDGRIEVVEVEVAGAGRP